MRVAFDNGLQYVDAPYITFARACDILGEDSLGRLLRTARSSKADVVVGDQDNFPGPRRGADQPWKRYFAKGADWEGRLPPEELDACREAGTEIVFLDTVVDSSTDVLRRFRDRGGCEPFE